MSGMQRQTKPAGRGGGNLGERRREVKRACCDSRAPIRLHARPPAPTVPAMPQPAPKPGDPKPPATYADILALPDHVVGQIIDGQLIVNPRPRVRHVRVGSKIGAQLDGAFDRKPNGPEAPGGWWILDEPELHLGKQVLVPDLAGWRHESLPELPDEAFFTQAPDWCCEVLSPESVRRDRIKKARIYAQQGVQWMWLVDPQYQTVEAFSNRGDGHWNLIDTWGGDDNTARIPPFDAIALELERWWMPVKPERDEP